MKHKKYRGIVILLMLPLFGLSAQEGWDAWSDIDWENDQEIQAAT